MPADREVLTVEFKINFLKPAKTDRVIAVGHVVQAGRTLTVCECSVFHKADVPYLNERRQN